MKASVSRAYFFEWGQLRKLMRKHGVPPAVCDARRHEIHVEVLGYDKSHKKFSTRGTNEVLKRFRELSGSITLTDYERGNRIYVIRQICASIGKPGDDYAQAIVDQMDREGRLSSGPLERGRQTPAEFAMTRWNAEVHRDATHRRLLHELTPADLDKVIIALRKFEERGVVREPARDQFADDGDELVQHISSGDEDPF